MVIVKLSPADAGTILEGSALRTDDELDLAVIRYAFEHGMEAVNVGSLTGRMFDLADKSAAESDDATAMEWFGDDIDVLGDLAVEWLTENVAPSGYVFTYNDGLVLISNEEMDIDPIDLQDEAEGRYLF